jgi:hypothetical protein
MAVANLSAWTSPNSVSIFLQAPVPGAAAFAAFILNQIPIPTGGNFRLDLAETEDAERTYQLTTNPVEVLTAQNRIRNPDTLNLTGMLSANPLLSPLQSLGLARLDKIALASFKVMLGALPLRPMFVVTPERSYPNMMLVSLREHYDDQTGNGVALTLSFREMQFAFPGGFADPDLDVLQLGAASSSSQGPTTPTEIVDPGDLG